MTGKIVLFRYGQKIFDKINEKLNPSFEGEDPINVFDFWEGANFKIKIKKVKGYANYDESSFDAPSALSKKDSDLETVWNAQHLLQPIIAPDQFKSYDELKKIFDFVTNSKPKNNNNNDNVSGSNDGDNTDDSVPFTTDEEEEDDTASFFARIGRDEE